MGSPPSQERLSPPRVRWQTLFSRGTSLASRCRLPDSIASASVAELSLFACWTPGAGANRNDDGALACSLETTALERLPCPAQ